MKASDYFKSMDEIRELVATYKDTLSVSDYSILMKVMGIGEQEGQLPSTKVEGMLVN